MVLASVIIGEKSRFSFLLFFVGVLAVEGGSGMEEGGSGIEEGGSGMVGVLAIEGGSGIEEGGSCESTCPPSSPSHSSPTSSSSFTRKIISVAFPPFVDEFE